MRLRDQKLLALAKDIVTKFHLEPIRFQMDYTEMLRLCLKHGIIRRREKYTDQWAEGFPLEEEEESLSSAPQQKG